MDELVDLVERMARSAIKHHARPWISRTGKVLERTPAEYISVTLPPHLQFETACGRLKFPREIEGLPLLISEKPSKINKPSGRWMISVMCMAGYRGRGSIGHVVLCPEDPT